MPISSQLDRNEKFLLGLILILSLPALFYNLGLQSFNEDEAIRSLVAFEMLDSGNFIVPTLNGLPYYYKPPLYNWFIALSFTVTGVVNEFTARLPTVIFLYLMCYVLYRCNRLYLNHKQSILLSLIFLTCGRILFWDSFMAFIDIAYSLVSYLVIFLSFHYYQKKKYNLFFIVPAVLTAVGYLMKGFPSFIFYGMSIGTVLLFKKDLRRIYKSLAPLAGLLIMCGIIGGFYMLYNQYHDFTNTLGPLMDQSTRRTIVRYDILSVIKHFFTYPFENIYHFFPYTLLGFLMVVPKIRKKVWAHEFSKYMLLLFIANIAVYWISPEVFPRYIIMLIPLSFAVILFMYFEAEDVPLKKYLDWFLKIIPLIPIIGIVLGFNHDELRMGEFGRAPLIVFAVLFLLIFVGSIVYDRYLLWLVVLTLLLTRIAFNIYVLPARTVKDEGTKAKKEILRIKEQYTDRPIRLYKKSIMDKSSSFYLATANGVPNEITEEISSDFYYIVDTLRVDIPNNLLKIDSFYLREFDRTAYLMITPD